MNHTEIQEQLFAYYDGELTAAVRRSVEEHLAVCADCRAAAGRWTRVASALFRAPAVPASEAFVEGVMRRISLPRPRPGLQWWLAPAWWVPALGLAAMLGLLVRAAPTPVSIEALLLAGAHEPDMLQHVVADDHPSADEMLGWLMEETS